MSPASSSAHTHFEITNSPSSEQTHLSAKIKDVLSMTANEENDEDIVHLLSSDEELFPISVRACQFSSFLSVALRRVDGINFEHRGNAQKKQIRVPNVRSKTLSIIIEYLNHRLSMKEKKEMKLKRKLRRREEGLTSSSSSNSDEEDLSDEEFEGLSLTVGGAKAKRKEEKQNFHVPAEEAMNVMMASNFLGC